VPLSSPNTRTGSRTLFCVGAFALAALAIAGCQKKVGPPPTMPPPKVTVTHPVPYPVQRYHEYNGHLDAIEKVDVKARVKGLLQDIHFTEGEEVAKGAKLYTIDPREYNSGVARSTAEVAKATADIDSWKAQVKLSEGELARLNRGKGSVSESDIDKARAAVEGNAAQLAVAQANKEAAAAALHTANIQLGYTDIRAEIAGRISRTLVTKGNLVGQDTTTLLTTIVSMHPLHVFFDAPERDLIEYQRALRAKAASPDERDTPVEIGVATEEGYPHHGKLDFRENRVDVGTGTVRIRGLIPNPTAPPNNARLLYPGLYARVRVPVGKKEPRPVIPEEALMTGQEGRFVYVLGANDVVEKRTIVVGTRVWQSLPPSEVGPPAWALANVNPVPPAGSEASASGPQPPARLPVGAIVAIEKGLEVGDRVIVNGLQKARPGLPVVPDNWELRAPPAPAGR